MTAVTEDGEGPILATRELTKRYGALVALDDVTIEFPQHTLTAIVGDNGAGKSTLLKLLSGAESRYDGAVIVDGEHRRLRTPDVARAHGIETVYQDLALADLADVTQNMFMGREWTRRIGPVRVLRKRAMRAEAADAMRRLDVKLPSVRAQVALLSGGQRQGIAIARAVYWGTRVIILDEPTAALGVQETAKVEELIAGLKDRGLTIILVSHNLDQVFRLADRIAVFRRGRLVGIRPTADTNPREIVGMITGLTDGAADGEKTAGVWA